MKYYKDANGSVFAYAADGSQDHAIPSGQSLITETEADELRNSPPSHEQLWAALRTRALVALNRTSVTIERCFEAGISLPSDWVSYRKALRVIIGSESGDPSQLFPERPDYPVGT